MLCYMENYQEDVGNIVHSGVFVTGYVRVSARSLTFPLNGDIETPQNHGSKNHQ